MLLIYRDAFFRWLKNIKSSGIKILYLLYAHQKSFPKTGIKLCKAEVHPK